MPISHAIDRRHSSRRDVVTGCTNDCRLGFVTRFEHRTNWEHEFGIGKTVRMMLTVICSWHLGSHVRRNRPDQS